MEKIEGDEREPMNPRVSTYGPPTYILLMLLHRCMQATASLSVQRVVLE